jgi:hypothetical protein
MVVFKTPDATQMVQGISDIVTSAPTVRWKAPYLVINGTYEQNASSPPAITTTTATVWRELVRRLLRHLRHFAGRRVDRVPEREQQAAAGAIERESQQRRRRRA